jgi:aryl-alcohol dehydrogenase
MDGASTMWDSSGAAIGGNFFGQSSFAYQALTSERNVIRLDCSETDLALFAPLGCGLQAGAGTVLNELQPKPGQAILILGVGAVGCGAMMAAKTARAYPIIVVDIIESRLHLAHELGADIIINAKAEPITSSVRRRLNSVMYAVDTTGRSSVINAALDLLHPKGTISLLAISADDKPLQTPTADQTVIESIAGNSNPQECIPHLIALYKKGAFPFDRLIKNYPAQDINAAVQDSLRGSVIKPVLRFS